MYVDSLELCARNRRSRRGIFRGIYGAWDGCTQVKYINDFIREQRFDKALRLQMKRHYNYRLRFKSVFLEDQVLGDLPPHLRAQVGRSSAPPTHPQKKKKKKKKKAVWSLPQKAVVGCGSPSACRLHSLASSVSLGSVNHRRAAVCLRCPRSPRFRRVRPPPRRCVFASSPLASVSLGSTTAAPLCVCVVAARLGFAGFNHRRAAQPPPRRCVFASSPLASVRDSWVGCFTLAPQLLCSNRSFWFVDEPRRLPPPRARRRSYISTATRCRACRTSASSRQSSRACSACCSPRSVRGGVSRIKTTTSYKRRTRCYSPPSCGA